MTAPAHSPSRSRSRAARGGAAALELYAVMVPLSIALSYLADGWLPPITAIDQVRHLLLPLAAPLLLIAVAQRRSAVAFGLLLSVLAGTWLYGPRLTASAPPAATSGEVLTIGSLTLGDAASAAAVADALLEARTDLWLLRAAPPGVLVDLARDVELRRRYPHRAMLSEHGKAILSRHPISSQAALKLASPTAHQVADLTVDGRPLRVINAQVSGWTALLGRLAPGAADLDALVERAVAAGGAAILAGDLGTSDQSAEYRRLVAAALRDAAVEAGRLWTSTWAPRVGSLALPPLLRRDHLLVKGRITTETFTTRDLLDGASHRAVIATLREFD